MVTALFRRLFGSREERRLRRFEPVLSAIEDHEERLAACDDDALRAQTDRLRDRVRSAVGDVRARRRELEEAMGEADTGADRDELAARLDRVRAREAEALEGALDDLLPEAFATVREASRRLQGETYRVLGETVRWDMVPYREQLIGAIALHRGTIAEMATGEGKTLVATLPVYLNALAGRGVHVVTVNEYLSRRDARWMGRLYEFLGLEVGCLDDTKPRSAARRAAYRADVTYGTNREFGFDYLRDHMSRRREDRVQRAPHYAIIDEIDSVLIDEARTPLVISGEAEGVTDVDLYRRYNDRVAGLVDEQRQLVDELLEEAGAAVEGGRLREAAEALWLVRRGAPDDERLAALVQREGVAGAMRTVEDDYFRAGVVEETEAALYYVVDEADRAVGLTDRGYEAIGEQPDAFLAPDVGGELDALDDEEGGDEEAVRERVIAMEEAYAEVAERMRVVQNLVKAHALVERDVDYVVEEGEVVIVDTFTGRKKPTRRWGEGFHQAVEAKEGLAVGEEAQTLARVTLQNYFRRYPRLAGMTGTAKSEEGEFVALYDLDVLVVPTHEPVRREDRSDLVYRTAGERREALVERVRELNAAGRPVLIGTASVEASERLSERLRRAGLRHEVLNAKQHRREARIIHEAGRPGRITVATNMAGRGADIPLHDDVLTCRVCRVRAGLEEGAVDAEAGCEADPTCGLHVLGTARHEARRIDRQLRGRAGRQGEPGVSRFYLSLDDDLLRQFGGDRVARVMEVLGAADGEPLTHRWVGRLVGRAQSRVETANFEARKTLLEYDDVVNEQREAIYGLREQVLEAADGGLERIGWQMVADGLEALVRRHTDERTGPDEWALETLGREAMRVWNLRLTFLDDADERAAWTAPDDLVDRVMRSVAAPFEARLEALGERRALVLREVLLGAIDRGWQAHLYELEHLQRVIRYRALGRRDPLVEFAREASDLFVRLEDVIRREVGSVYFRLEVDEVS